MDRIRAAQVFIETVARGSLSSAAKHLHLSRATATRYLVAMEKWADVCLLERTTRKITLTEAGERLLPICRELLSLSEDVGLITSAAPQLRGSLRIAAPRIFAEYCLNDILISFLAKYPAMLIDLQITDRPIDMTREGIDLAIHITRAPDPKLEATKLGECSWVMCASPVYVQAKGLPKNFSDLESHNCLTRGHCSRDVWQFVHKQKPMNVEVHGNLCISEATIIRDAAVKGAGIALMPRFAVIQALRDGRLVTLLPEYTIENSSCYAIYEPRPRIPISLQVLIAYLADQLTSLH